MRAGSNNSAQFAATRQGRRKQRAAPGARRYALKKGEE